MSKQVPQRLLFYLLIIGILTGFSVSSFRADCFAQVSKIEIETRTSCSILPFEIIEPKRLDLMLALSGGGMRGLAHIGVLQVLDEEGIKVDGIVGVSIGALVGGLYASGMSPAVISRLIREIDISTVMFDRPERSTLALARKDEYSRDLLTLRFGEKLAPVVPGAISAGQRFYEQLLTLTLSVPVRNPTNWNDLPIPLRILSTDLASGEKFIFSEGDLTSAIRASMAIPLLFDPFEMGSLLLIDGGISSNIPVETASGLSEDNIVLAVDVSSPLWVDNPPYKPWQIVDRVTTILEEDKNEEEKSLADIVVLPDLGNISSVSTVDIDSIVNIGRQAMRRRLTELKTLLNPAANNDDSELLTIEHIIYQNEKLLNTSIPEKWLETGAAEKRQIRSYLRKTLENGYFASIHAEHDNISGTLWFKSKALRILNRVILSGERLLPDSLLLNAFTSLIGKQINSGKLEAALMTVISKHRRAGFPVVTFTEINFDENTGILKADLVSGVVDEIIFSGLGKVPEAFLHGEIPLRKGDYITRRDILKGTKNLIATGLFRNVYPILTKSVNVKNGWNIVILVSENPSPLLRLGLSYFGEHMDEQGERLTRGFLELLYPSPFNYAARMVFFVAADLRDKHYKSSFLADRIFGLPLTYDLSLYYKLRKRHQYNNKHNRLGLYSEELWGGGLAFGGQAKSWGSLTLTSRWERHVDKYIDKQIDFRLAVVGGKLEIDTQDRTPFPNNGILTKLQFETSRNFLGSQQNYHKLWGKIGAYKTPVDRLIVGMTFKGGTSDRTTPRDERFRLGGLYSFPGLHLDELIGTLHLAGSAEVRYDLISKILADSYIGFKYFVGSSWSDPEPQFKKEDWMQSTSFYIALDTILGPIVFQWSYLHPNSSYSKQDILYIQLGNLF